MKFEHTRQVEEQQRDGDSDSDDIHDPEKNAKLKGRLCHSKFCCKMPEQKRPIDKY